jgi:argonaute-like protein implicated in RNA metabolism and viral defense
MLKNLSQHIKTIKKQKVINNIKINSNPRRINTIAYYKYAGLIYNRIRKSGNSSIIFHLNEALKLDDAQDLESYKENKKLSIKKFSTLLECLTCPGIFGPRKT